MQKVFRFVFILFDSSSCFTMRDYHVGTHYSIYIKLRRLLLLFHARLFLTKFLSAEKSGTPQRARIFAEIAGKRTYIRLSERFIEAHSLSITALSGINFFGGFYYDITHGGGYASDNREKSYLAHFIRFFVLLGKAQKFVRILRNRLFSTSCAQKIHFLSYYVRAPTPAGLALPGYKMLQYKCKKNLINKNIS